MKAYIGERLCKEVRKYPHLYNCSMKQYKDIYMGYNSWIEIVQTLALLGQERYWNLVQRACVEHLCTRHVTSQSLFNTNHITRHPSLKRLWGMQVQPVSLWMGKHTILPNCSLSLWLNFIFEIVTVHGSVCSFCVRLCGWTRSLCLSALPSDRAPDEVIRTVTGVARLHCLYLAGISVVRCQIVFTLVVFLLSVSVFQVLRLFSPGRVSVSPWRVPTGLYSLPELETLHCRVYCTAGFTAPALPMISAPPLCFGVCTCTASLSSPPLCFGVKDYLFFTRNWISSFLYRDRNHQRNLTTVAQMLFLSLK